MLLSQLVFHSQKFLNYQYFRWFGLSFCVLDNKKGHSIIFSKISVMNSDELSNAYTNGISLTPFLKSGITFIQLLRSVCSSKSISKTSNMRTNTGMDRKNLINVMTAKPATVFLCR